MSCLGQKRANFISRKIRRAEPFLTNSEKQIAELLLKNPEKFMHSTISEISEESGTGVSTVTRFSQKLGYSGISDLKLALSQDLAQSVNYLHEDLTPSDNTESYIRKIINANSESLRDTEKALNPKDVEKAVQMITDANRVVFFGSGGSASVAMDAHHKFIRTGINVDAVTDSHKQLMYAALAKATDVFVGISHEGTSQNINEALKISKKNDAKVIAITQFSMSEMTSIADVSLYTMSRETLFRPESLTSRIAAYTITDILYIGVSLKRQDELKKNIPKIRESMEILKRK